MDEYAIFLSKRLTDEYVFHARMTPGRLYRIENISGQHVLCGYDESYFTHRRRLVSEPNEEIDRLNQLVTEHKRQYCTVVDELSALKKDHERLSKLVESIGVINEINTMLINEASR